MDGKNLFSIILSIAIIVGVFLSLGSTGILPFEGLNQKSILEIKSNEEFVKGENAVFEVKAENSFLIKKISYTSPTKTEEKICEKTECTTEFNEVFQKPGVFFVEFKIELDNGNVLKEKKKITVTETGKKCADGTGFGECSENNPKYCENGKLIDGCEICGCSTGECIEGKCVFKGKFIVEEIQLEKPFIRPKEQVNLTVKAIQIPSEEFSFIIEWENNQGKESQTITQNLCSSCTKSFSVKINAPEKEGKYSVKLINQTEVYSIQNITVRNDSSAPSTPTGLTARKSDGMVLVGWNENKEEDLMAYYIYRSAEDNQAYTTYTLAETVLKGETGKEMDLWQQNNYMYLTAIDYYGNESAPSAVIEAT